MSEALTRAETIAEEVLFPQAMEIDRSPVVPRRYLDELAAAGLYDLPGEPEEAARIIETLGGASLVTAFVWIQHHSPVRAVAAAGGDMARRWLGPLRSGQIRAGIAYAALRRPGPPSAVASAAPGGRYRLSGRAPWVTGWGLIDVVLAGARCGEDIVWLLVDALPAPEAGFSAVPVELATLQASSTYELRWDDFEVPAERVIGREPFAEWRLRDAAGRATNGYLTIGVAARCARLLESPALMADADRSRQSLLRSTPDTVVEARAASSLVALRAAAALVAAGGGRSVEASSHAARLMREATFLLVFGQSPDIKRAQLASLLTG